MADQDDDQKKSPVAPPDSELPLTAGRVPAASLVAPPSAVMPAPTARAPVATVAPPHAPPAHQGFLESLYQREGSIGNPFLKGLARTGTGIVRAAEGLATPFVPELAFVPGTEANAMMQNRDEERGRMNAATIAQKQAQADTAKENAAANTSRAASEATKAATGTAEQPSIIKRNEAEAQNLGHEAQKPFAEVKPDWIAAVNPANKQPEYYDRATKQWTGVVPYEKAANPQHPMAGTVEGKEAYAYPDPSGTGFVDANTGKKLADFVPMPNYGQVAPSIRTVEVIDDNPNSPTYGMPIQKTLAGQTLGVAGAGAYGHSVAQAGAVERSASRLIQDINDNRDQVGNVNAIVKSAFLNTPLADPHQRMIAAEIGSFAALNPALHGFRGQNALEQFEKLIGGIPENPDALIAGIQGLVRGAAEPIQGGTAPKGANAPPSGAKVLGRYNPTTGKIE